MRSTNNAGTTERHEVKVKCSRCAAVVDGVRGPGYTGGFYDVTEGFWHIFSRHGEKRLCDNCMHASPEYQHVYGVQPGIVDVRDTPRGRMVAYKLKAIANVQNAVHMQSGYVTNKPLLLGERQEQLCIIGPKIPTLVTIGEIRQAVPPKERA